MDAVSALIQIALLVVVLAALALLLRWAFGDDRRAVPDHTGEDFGLLSEVAVVPTPEAARVLAARLREAGIKTTVATRGDLHRLLVFPADAANAKLLLR
ncbi:hypothetical protein [Actinosynnema sp. NPDC023587]|uniref:hypothetical protein n=1 Tax=Actinosynnema sp. NPDC023587 TaxID=3154695 RepID=UPI0033C3AF30